MTPGVRRTLGIIGIVGGLALGGGGAVMAVSSGSLSGDTVGSPGSGMVATAEGTGASGAPTHVEPAATNGSVQSLDGFAVPTTPTLYLEAADLLGVHEASYWKVWWNGQSQVKAVVSLQKHVDASDAQQELSDLDARNRDPSQFSFSSASFSLTSTFSPPGIPGGRGYLWSGSEQVGGQSIQLQYIFDTFTNGDVAELVSYTAYNKSLPRAAFNAFAQRQYGLNIQTSGDSGPAGLLIVLGLVLLIVGIVTVARSGRNRQANVANFNTGYPPYGYPGAGGYPANAGPQPGYPPPYARPGYPPPAPAQPSGWSAPLPPVGYVPPSAPGTIPPPPGGPPPPPGSYAPSTPPPPMPPPMPQSPPAWSPSPPPPPPPVPAAPPLPPGMAPPSSAPSGTGGSAPSSPGAATDEPSSPYGLGDGPDVADR